MTTFAERFRNEGRDEGRREEALDMLLEALFVKFKTVPDDIKNILTNLKEPPKLKYLLRHAILCNNIRDFEDKLHRISG